MIEPTTSAATVRTGSFVASCRAGSRLQMVTQRPPGAAVGRWPLETAAYGAGRRSASCVSVSTRMSQSAASNLSTRAAFFSAPAPYSTFHVPIRRDRLSTRAPIHRPLLVPAWSLSRTPTVGTVDARRVVGPPVHPWTRQSPIAAHLELPPVGRGGGLVRSGADVGADT